MNEEECEMSKTFEFGLLCDAAPLDQINKGWDYLEVPNFLMVNPFGSENLWEIEKAKIVASGFKCKTSSHYTQLGGTIGMRSCGPNYDREQQMLWAKRSFRRMKEIGVEVVGIYGKFFPVVEGFSATKAMDQAISFCNILADEAEANDMLVALEPMADLHSLWPRYLDGIKFAKEVNRKSVKVMADLNYFYELNQPLEDIYVNPELNINVHIAGSGGAQPNVGTYEQNLIKLFKILKDTGYTRGVTAACPWVSTKGGDLDWAYETEVTINYLKNLRDSV
jgi:sugar phosphate isomerase/epimerase